MEKHSIVKHRGNVYLFFLGGLFLLSSASSLYFLKGPIGQYLGREFQMIGIAAALNQDNPKVLSIIGDYYFSSRGYDIEKAEATYERIIELDPAFPRAHYQLSRIHFIKGGFSEALGEINTELELYPEYKRSYYIRGLVYGYAGLLDLAIADFQTFLEWKPKSWAGHNDLVWVYFQKGDYAEAKAIAMRGLEIAPDNPWLGNALGVALLNLNEFEAAEAALEQAARNAEKLTAEEWGAAYPGNDPAIYPEGLAAMHTSIQENLKLIEKKLLERKT